MVAANRQNRDTFKKKEKAKKQKQQRILLKKKLLHGYTHEKSSVKSVEELRKKKTVIDSNNAYLKKTTSIIDLHRKIGSADYNHNSINLSYANIDNDNSLISTLIPIDVNQLEKIIIEDSTQDFVKDGSVNNEIEYSEKPYSKKIIKGKEELKSRVNNGDLKDVVESLDDDYIFNDVDAIPYDCSKYIKSGVEPNCMSEYEENKELSLCTCKKLCPYKGDVNGILFKTYDYRDPESPGYQDILAELGERDDIVSFCYYPKRHDLKKFL